MVCSIALSSSKRVQVMPWGEKRPRPECVYVGGGGGGGRGRGSFVIRRAKSHWCGPP